MVNTRSEDGWEAEELYTLDDTDTTKLDIGPYQVATNDKVGGSGG